MSLIQLYRICDPEFAKTPQQMLSGVGSFLYGGRWNSPGNRAVYLAESLSLAAYELLVHVPYQVLQPYKRLSVRIPEDLIMVLDDSKLPKDWESPSHPELAGIGDSWIASNSSLGLSLPSALIPGERNVIIRPDHEDFSQIEIGEIEDFHYDPRLSGLKSDV